MRNCAIGTYAKQVGGFRAFIPNPFPIPNLLVAPPSITLKADKASRLVGKLDGAANALPDVDFFVRMFTAKDAAASAQLAGTRATIIDALEEQAGAPTAATDAADIIQCIDALEYGVERLQEVPLSAALIREVHAKLTTDDRASRDHAPGEWRTAQNWIGGAKPRSAAFVPPPPSDLPRALADFERFLNIRRVVPLIQIGVAHAQFETIHPFADGNGRVGRILITLALCQRKLLAKPLLCLSSYFKKHQQTYCDKLNDYHGGSVAGWVGFFLDGVIETATEAIKIADRIRRLRDRDMAKIQVLGRREAASGVKTLYNLLAAPIVTTGLIMDWTGFTRAGAQGLIDRFVKLDILEPLDRSDSYDRTYAYRRYVNLFIDKE